MTNRTHAKGCEAHGSVRSLLLLCAQIGAALAVMADASARPAIDCPLREQAYSIDSPLIDVLLNPKATAVLEREVPGMLQRMPPAFRQVPTFAAIITLRMSADDASLSEETLENLNRELLKIPVTAVDRETRCARYDVERPRFEMPPGHPRLLVFEKINGFRDLPSVEAARAALRAMAQRLGWALVFTEKGGAMSSSILKQFDAVIWNNVSGDVLTLAERQAFRGYIYSGGGFAGFHGSGGDPLCIWNWYADTLIGARFAGHPMNPQFQDARIVVEDKASSIVRGLPSDWTMNDEWYSFKNNPRATGARVLATLDEFTYSPVFSRPGIPSRDLRMGDHPIAWTRCVGKGRSFYSAIGHRPESYSEPHYVELLEHGIIWAAGGGEAMCRRPGGLGAPVPR